MLRRCGNAESYNEVYRLTTMKFIKKMSAGHGRYELWTRCLLHMSHMFLIIRTAWRLSFVRNMLQPWLLTYQAQLALAVFRSICRRKRTRGCSW